MFVIMCKPEKKWAQFLKHDITAIEKLKKLSITDVCVANNHYYDYGVLASEVSTEILKSNGFVVHGDYGKDYQANYF